MRRGVIVIALVLLATATVATALLLAGGGANTDNQSEHLAEGRELYLENCAACHGQALEGQPDWRKRLPNGRMPAPPHDETGHTWHHSDQQLFRITQDGVAQIVGGGYESDMPGFADVLTEDDIWAVLDYIKSTWPERERGYQAEISARNN